LGKDTAKRDVFDVLIEQGSVQHYRR